MLMISLKELPHSSQHDHAHRLLKECLRLCGIEYNEDAGIAFGTYGKPSLSDYPDVHYNLSHANGITVCLISGCECGADAEKVRPYRPKVMKRAFSESEAELVENAPESERDLLFFRIWTLKESYVKALGIGVSYPLKTAEFLIKDNGIVTNAKGFDFRQYILKEGGFVVSLCFKKRSV